MKERYMYIRIKVQDGDREHTHHCLHTTKCKSLDFAATWFTAHYWGLGVLDNSYTPNFNQSATKPNKWWFDDEIICELYTWRE